MIVCVCVCVCVCVRVCVCVCIARCTFSSLCSGDACISIFFLEKKQACVTCFAYAGVAAFNTFFISVSSSFMSLFLSYLSVR